MSHIERLMGSKKVHEPIACLHRLLAHREALRDLKDINDLAAWRALTRVTVSLVKVEAFLLSEDLNIGRAAAHVIATTALKRSLEAARRGYVDEDLFFSLYSDYLATVSKVNDRVTLSDAMVAATTVAFCGVEEFNSPRAIMQWLIETVTVEIASFSEVDIDLEVLNGTVVARTSKHAKPYNAVGAACARVLDAAHTVWVPYLSADASGATTRVPNDLGYIDEVSMKKSDRHGLEARFQLLLAKRELLVGKEDVLNYRLNPGSNLRNNVGSVFFKSESAKAKYRMLGQILTKGSNPLPSPQV